MRDARLPKTIVLLRRQIMELVRRLRRVAGSDDETQSKLLLLGAVGTTRLTRKTNRDLETGFRLPLMPSERPRPDVHN